MEINGQYLTYEEYRGLGGTLDLTSFNLLEFECRRKIDLRTQNRLKNADIPQEVKICEYKMINNIEEFNRNKSDVSNKASENIDGYSVSYLTSKDIIDVIKENDNELEDVIYEYLTGVKVEGHNLTYLGV